MDRISFGSHEFEDLHIEGGALFGIDGKSEAIDRKNAFVGRVTIKNLYLPRKTEEGDLLKEEDKRAQLMYEFRNIRMYLSKKGDVLAAGTFHAAELALERKDENCVTAALNALYEKISDYGNSTVRPLLSTLGSYTLLSSLIYINSSVSVTICKDTQKIYGWQETLCQSDLLVAASYPLYAVLNPLNAFAPNAIMISKAPSWAIIHGIFTLLCIASAILFVLAVRRRFKLEKDGGSS